MKPRHSINYNPLPVRGRGLLLGAFCALLVFGVQAPGWIDVLQRGTMDSMFFFRAAFQARSPHPNIVIVVADDDTVHDQKFRNKYPLPRSVYANLVRRLNRAGARSISFDMLFTNPSPSAKDDAEFIKACRETKRVISSAHFHVATRSNVTVPPGEPQAPPAKFAATDRGGIFRTAVWTTTSINVDSVKTPAVGHVVVFPEWDGVLRRIPLLIRYRDKVYPSLALATAAHFMGLKPRDIVTRPDGVELAGRFVPMDRHGETLLNWVGGNDTFPSYSLRDVLAGVVPNSVFRGSVVLIGVTAAGAYEHHATPLESAQPAVELQATALDNILSERPLYTISDATQTGLLFAFAMLAGVFITRRGAVNGTFRTFSLGLLFTLTAYCCFAYLDIYIAVDGPLLAAFLTGVLSIAYQQIEDASDLKLAEERYAVAVQGANDGLWDWDLTTNTIYFSPRWMEMLGYESGELGSSPDEWMSRVHPDELDDLKSKLGMHLEGTVPHFQIEHRMRHKDGSYRWMLSRGLRVCDGNGRPTRIAGSQTDVTDRRRAEDQLRHDALHDGLTDLPNRALLMDRLRHALDLEKRRRDYGFVVLFLDFDEFKVVNDSLGHVVGDRLLVAIAERLKSCMRPGDTVARLGGDEFVILLDDVEDLQDPARVANRLHLALALPFHITAPDGTGHEIYATTSIGIALSTTGYQRPEDLLRDADIAMYRAKGAGRGQHAIFDEDMHVRALEALRLETDLRNALQSNRRGAESFRVYYQPIISLQTGRIAGFEALARWQHPERGLVFPGGFIKLAEDTGLIIPIDQWMLREACVQIRAWEERYGSHYRAREEALLYHKAQHRAEELSQAVIGYGPIGQAGRIDQRESGSGANPNLHSGNGHKDASLRNGSHRPSALSISVNLSARQFSQSDMVKNVKTILDESGVDPQCVKLEITEGVLMENAEAAADMLLQLKQLGLRLSIDDFGTGYSSLSYLHRFPLDTLKVDRSFISRMDTQRENTEIVHAIVGLAHNLKMDVVAEGVETREQLALLKSTLRCDYGQGYLFAQPLTRDEAEELLESDPCWLS